MIIANYELPLAPGQPRDAVAYCMLPGVEQRQYVVPLEGESDYAAIRRVAAEVGVKSSSFSLLRNLR